MNSAEELTKLSEMDKETAKKQGLEPVYPNGHKYAERIFYDKAKGRYYDSATDMYLDIEFDPKKPVGIGD